MLARELAYAVLKDWTPRGAFAGERLDAIAAKRGVEPRERALATELTFGVVRRLATLDAILRPHVARPKKEVEPDLWTLLRLGAYQLTFLSGMADHAAVNETVELAKRAGKPRWAGFVNAVLRKLAATLTDDVLSSPTADGVPLPDGRYRLLAVKAFPDPEADPAGYFAEAFGFPTWLAKRWSERFDDEELFALGRHFDAPPPATLRVNRLRTTREQAIEELKAAGIKGKPSGRHPDAVRLKESARVDDLPGFREGRITVQDETAMHAATLLAPQPGMRVLDLCAAPGTKTTHLAEIMGDAGAIVAADVSPERLLRVQENVARLGIKIIQPAAIGEEGAGLPDGPFDAALVDVPCSNTGVLGKRPEARWRVGPDDLRQLPPLQARLLSLALDRVRPGGAGRLLDVQHRAGGERGGRDGRPRRPGGRAGRGEYPAPARRPRRRRLPGADREDVTGRRPRFRAERPAEASSPAAGFAPSQTCSRFAVRRAGSAAAARAAVVIMDSEGAHPRLPHLSARGNRAEVTGPSAGQGRDCASTFVSDDEAAARAEAEGTRPCFFSEPQREVANARTKRRKNDRDGPGDCRAVAGGG